MPDILSDYDAVKRVIETYVDGGRSGKGEVMRQAFHDSATIAGMQHGTVTARPMETLYAWTDEKGPATDLKAEIVRVDITGHAASVCVKSEGWHGGTFTDYLTLVKFTDGWKITAKVYMTHE